MTVCSSIDYIVCDRMPSSGRKKTSAVSAAPPLTLRLGPDLLKRIEAARDLYVAEMRARGLGLGPAKDVTQAEMLRWALEEGLTVIQKRLSRKGGPE